MKPPSSIWTATHLLDTAFARNPGLKVMEADVRVAEASIAAARKSKVPDFSAGLQAEVYSPPFYWPQASMTLPIWRDKIAAQIAAAQAGKRGAEARLTSGQITLTVDFAMKTYEYPRNHPFPRAPAKPNSFPRRKNPLNSRSRATLRADDFFNLIDAERTLLNFQLSEVEAAPAVKIILADLSLTIAGIAPAGAPFLPDAAHNSRPSPNH